MDFRELLSWRIGQAMHKHPELTHRDWAQLWGCGAATVSRIRTGRCVPSVERLCRIADALDVSVDWLCGRTS
mgnify:CR=1 FL=1